MRKPQYGRVYKDCECGDERAVLADEEWAGLIQHLDDMGQLTDQRKKIVDRLVRLRVEYAFAYSEAQKEGAVLKGPNGGDVYNMRVAHLHKVEDRILKLEEALKIPVSKEAGDIQASRPTTKADKFLDRLGSRQ